jgi:putative transposase
MVYKLMQSASKKWRLLNGTKVLVEVLHGTIFIYGICVPQVAA